MEMFKLNFPVVTKEAQEFWASKHKSNRLKAIAAFSLNRENYNEMSIEIVDVLPQGMRRNFVVISEGDLYRLVMGSTLPSAVAFQNWVCEEVLPSIRDPDMLNIPFSTLAEPYWLWQ